MANGLNAAARNINSSFHAEFGSRMKRCARDILNPLFAETETLDGVGPKLAKPLSKLGLTRIRDVAYHLPERFVIPPSGRGSGRGR